MSTPNYSTHQIVVHNRTCLFQWLPYAPNFVTIIGTGEKIDVEGLTTDKDVVEYIRNYLTSRCGGFVITQFQLPIYPGRPHHKVIAKKVDSGDTVAFDTRKSQQKYTITQAGRLELEDGYVIVEEIPFNKYLKEGDTPFTFIISKNF